MSASEEQLRFFVRLIRLEKLLPPLPTVNDALTAAFLGIDVGLLTQVRSVLGHEVEVAAKGLLSDPTVRENVDRLSFLDGRAIVGLGDSLTADGQSWFEILARVVTLRHPGRELQFINAGVSGETTTQMLARMPSVGTANPACVLCLAGGNDARRFGSLKSPVQVSAQETQRNLQTMRSAVPGASWLWLAPPAARHDRMANSPFWASLRIHWTKEDLDAVSDMVCQQTDPVLDLRPVLGDRPAADLLLDDGLHPTLRGHCLIARSVIAKLAAS